jgi:hypothetical protein
VTRVAATATPTRRALPDVDAGVIEEARRRQRRHRGMAGVTLAGAAGFAAIMLAFFGGGGNASGGRGQPSTRPHSASLTVATVAPSMVLVRQPWIGSSCPGPHSPAAVRASFRVPLCSRVGLMIGLRTRAVSATATINGQRFKLDSAAWSDPPVGGKHEWLSGFLQHARFLYGPFKTVSFRNGIRQRFTIENVHLVIDYGAGHKVQTSLQLLGYGGWG